MAVIAKPPCDEAAILTGVAEAADARRGRWVLAATILGSSLAFIDSTVVNVALPALQSALDATLADVQWVVEAYALTLAALLLTGGSLGDARGRRTVFAAGVVIFAAASAWCGLSRSIGELIAARALQGVGAALLVPGSLALISASFPPAAARSRHRHVVRASPRSRRRSVRVLGGWLVQHLSVALGLLHQSPARPRRPRDHDLARAGDARRARRGPARLAGRRAGHGRPRGSGLRAD